MKYAYTLNDRIFDAKYMNVSIIRRKMGFIWEPPKLLESFCNDCSTMSLLKFKVQSPGLSYEWKRYEWRSTRHVSCDISRIYMYNDAYLVDAKEGVTWFKVIIENLYYGTRSLQNKNQRIFDITDELALNIRPFTLFKGPSSSPAPTRHRNQTKTEMSLVTRFWVIASL